MSKVEIELDSAGIQALLKSPEIVDVLQEQADSIRAQLGDRYQTSQHIGKTRANVSVYTEDPDALRDNAKNNTMLKAMGVKMPSSNANAARTGKKVEGYWRKGKNGKKIWVNAYQRRK